MKSIEKILFPNHSLNDICEKARDVQAYFIEKYYTLLSRTRGYFEEKMNKTRERGLWARIIPQMIKVVWYAGAMSAP